METDARYYGDKHSVAPPSCAIDHPPYPTRGVGVDSVHHGVGGGGAGRGGQQNQPFGGPCSRVHATNSNRRGSDTTSSRDFYSMGPPSVSSEAESEMKYNPMESCSGGAQPPPGSQRSGGPPPPAHPMGREHYHGNNTHGPGGGGGPYGGTGGGGGGYQGGLTGHWPPGYGHGVPGGVICKMEADE